jgi:hypothetical protein
MGQDFEGSKRSGELSPVVLTSKNLRNCGELRDFPDREQKEVYYYQLYGGEGEILPIRF